MYSQDPRGDIRLPFCRKGALIPNLKDSRIRPNGIRDIVGAMSERGGGSGHDLEEAVHVLGLVVVVGSVGVQLVQITREHV